MAFAPTPTPLQWAPFPSLLPVWLEPGVMDLAGWNQLLANEDFPTGLGLGKENSSCRLDSWLQCPLGREPREREGPCSVINCWQPIHYWQHLAEMSLLLLLVLSPRFLPVTESWFIPTSCSPNESTDRIQIQFVSGSQFKRKKKNEDGMALW